MSEGEVAITFSKAEALVLFEFLARSDENGAFSFEDTAEQRVVWLLLAQLERDLVEPLRPDYASLLRRARDLVRDASSNE